MAAFLISLLKEAPLCLLWCSVWHYVFHLDDHKAKKQPKKTETACEAEVRWIKFNHDHANGGYGHSGSFDECKYPLCKMVRGTP